MSKTCVIIPTIRNPDCIIDYIQQIKSYGHNLEDFKFLLITEDFCEKDEMRAMINELNINGNVFGESERENWLNKVGLKNFSDLIPKKSHAQTSFGLLWMLENPEYEFGVFIDDDTRPHPDFDFFGDHLDILETSVDLPHVSSNENWVNVLHQNFERHHLYPRGYPYSCMEEEISIIKKETEEVVACQGLWTNIPDLDAVRILWDGNLKGQANTKTHKEDFPRNFAVNSGNYLTVCSMNLSFHRKVIPSFYQLPMDDNQWDIGRFDDIWSGITLKKAADLIGESIVTGHPLCQHNKFERSTFSDLLNEAPALELNEHFWKAVDTAEGDPNDYLEAYELIVESIDNYDFSKYQNSDFIDFTVEKMYKWIQACKKLNNRN